MHSNREDQTNLLSLEDIRIIDATNLTSIQKHHLRILAYCLESFRAMARESYVDTLPTISVRRKWLKSNLDLGSDDQFIDIMLQQLSIAEKELDELARSYQISPLSLTIQHLIKSSSEWA